MTKDTEGVDAEGVSKKIGSITAEEKDKLFKLYMATLYTPVMQFGKVNSLDAAQKELDDYQNELVQKYKFDREKCAINELGEIIEVG